VEDGTKTNTSWRDIRRRRVKTGSDERDVAAERWLLRFAVLLNGLRRRRGC